MLLSLGVPASYTLGKIAVKRRADLRKLIPKTRQITTQEEEQVEQTPENVAQNEFQAAELPTAPEEMEMMDFNAAAPEAEHAFENPLFNQEAQGQGIQENAIEGQGTEAPEAGAEAGEAGEAAEAGAEVAGDVATTEEKGVGLDAAGLPEVGLVVAVIGGIMAGVEGLKDLFEHHSQPRIVNNLPQMGV